MAETPNEKVTKSTEDTEKKTYGVDVSVDDVSKQISKLSLDHKVGIMFDDAMLLHSCYGHPERPDRLKAIIEELKKQSIYDKCIQVPSREATEEEITLVHSKKVRDAVVASKDIKVDNIHFNGDTYANKYTSRAAHIAAGGLIELTKRVVDGTLTNGFAFIRPPGHHAEQDEILGFCLFNNVAVAAEYARQKLGLKKILIVDWDVHHGNGTQHIFEKDEDIVYFSVHKGGLFYPGTGKVDEVGLDKGIGKTVNVPFLLKNMGDGDYYRCFKHIFIPIAEEFKPELIIISAGFDCAAGDLLGPMKVSPKGFEHMLSMLMKVNGKVVCALEGGYELVSTSNSAAACMKILLGKEPSEDIEKEPSVPGMKDLKTAVNIQKKHWKCIEVMEASSEWKELCERLEKKQAEDEKNGVKYEKDNNCNQQ